jgi:hypothetical protein
VDLLPVKTLLRELRESNAWDPDLCLITEVLVVKSAWICFATDRDQVAEIKGSASLPLATEPDAALEAVAASGKVSASWKSQKSRVLRRVVVWRDAAVPRHPLPPRLARRRRRRA